MIFTSIKIDFKFLKPSFQSDFENEKTHSRITPNVMNICNEEVIKNKERRSRMAYGDLQSA